METPRQFYQRRRLEIQREKAGVSMDAFNPDLLIDMDDEQLKEHGVNKQKLRALLRRLHEADQYLAEMGLCLYVAGGTPTVVTDLEDGRDGIIATLIVEGQWDGGDW